MSSLFTHSASQLALSVKLYAETTNIFVTKWQRTLHSFKTHLLSQNLVYRTVSTTPVF